MSREPFTIEYTTMPAEQRRRVRFEPVAADGELWYRITERFTGDGWRPEGRETVSDVRAETTKRTVIA